MAKKRSRRKKTEPATSEELFRSSRNERVNRLREKRGMFPRKILICLALLAIFIAFLPSIIVRTPLKQVIIDRALADFKGKVTVESISCGWIANTELRNVHAVDEEGEMLFSVATVKLRKSLTSMLNASDYGTIEIREPVLNLEVRPDGSNLEDAIADMLTSDASTGPAPAMRLSITDGRALITDTTTGFEYPLEEVASLVEAFQPDEAPLRIELEGKLTGPEGPAGKFNAKVVIDAGKDQIEFENGLIELASENFSIDIATPFITRFVEPMAVAGVFTGDVKASWNTAGSTVDLQMESAAFNNLLVTVPQRIGNDRINLKNAWLRGNVSITPKTMEADNFVCQTDIGSLNANGKMNWEQFAAVAGAQIPANNFEAEGSVNLAPLVAMLPNTMPLQEGIEIESGTLQFNANSRIEGEVRRLVVNLESSGLTAIRNGQRLNWNKPARVVAAIRQNSDNSIHVESLDCTTNFLTLSGTATTEGGEFIVKGDLKLALAEVNQFFDLGGTQLEGIVDGRFGWEFEGSPTDKLTSRPMVAGGQFQIDGPLVNLPGQTSWTEEEINVVIQAQGQLMPVTTAQSRVIRLDSGRLKLTNAGERQTFEANLVEPLENPSPSSTWKLDCKLGGNVQNWLAQISTFLPIQADATGSIDANALVTVDPLQVTVHRSNFELTDLDFSGYGISLTEPQMLGNAVMTYGMQSGILEISDASLASSAISARSQQLVVDGQSSNGSLSGQIAFRADVNRFLGLFGGPSAADAIQWFGSAHGTIDLQTTVDSIGGNVAINVDDLVAAQMQPAQPGTQNVSSGGSWSRLLEEKLVTLNSNLRMSRSFDQVTFENTHLNASAANILASGSISDLSGSMNTNIQGTWQPDWKRLKPLLDSMLGGLASFEGVEGGGFQMSGPIFNPNSGQPGQPWIHPDLQVAAAASWQNGHALGMPIGGSRLDLQLAQGIASINTDTIQFGGGKIQLSPRLDLRGQEMVLFMPQGRVIDNVELTPELCRGWMKYVAPMLADATSAEGRFSIDTGEVIVPLGRLTAASVNGHAVLHGANVGPGPLSQQMIGVISQIKAIAKGQPIGAATMPSNSTWIRMPEQQVSFAVHEGRVHHRGMQIQIDDVVIQTAGSVGLDQSMQLVAQIPIMDSWVGTNRYTQGLRGQTLQIPIGGTVSNPRVDSRALQKISQQLLQQAAGAAINNEVQGLIDKGNQRLEQEITNGLKGLLGGDR